MTSCSVSRTVSVRIQSCAILAWTHIVFEMETGKFVRASSGAVSGARTDVEAVGTYRYWTLSKRLMPGPYIRSRRSNRVVSKVRGGRKLGCLDGLLFDGWFGCSAASTAGSVSAAMTTSPCIVSDSESEPVSGLESVTSSCLLSVKEDLLLSGLESFVDAPLLSELFLCCFSDDFACLPFFSRLSKDKMVGGSCMGSPARINFFPLNMGTQHT